MRHETSVQEVHALLDNAAEDILTARLDMAAGWKFAIAYNAALRLCSIPLFLSGYQAIRNQKHYRTIAALPLVLGDGVSELADYLNRCRVKRSEVTYDSVYVVSLTEAEELIDSVDGLRGLILRWVEEHHPSFLP